jgi:hypothetical protein
MSYVSVWRAVPAVKQDWGVAGPAGGQVILR